MIKLASAAFADKTRIPAEYTRTSGQPDRSPPLSWSEPPHKTRSYALVCIDPHPVAKNWVHWILFDLPVGARHLNPDQARTSRLGNGTRQGLNSYGDTGWGGPQPPPGSGTHPYEFTLYALDLDKLPVKSELPALDEVRSAMKGHVVAEATYTGFYSQ